MIAESIAVFFCQMFYVFLLGIQSRNVRDGQYLSAAITSCTLGAAGLFMTSAIARSAMIGGSAWLAISYIAAGPCGICLAMKFHDRLSDRFENNTFHRRRDIGKADGALPGCKEVNFGNSERTACECSHPRITCSGSQEQICSRS
jgi:hypothetical protein